MELNCKFINNTKYTEAFNNILKNCTYTLNNGFIRTQKFDYPYYLIAQLGNVIAKASGKDVKITISDITKNSITIEYDI